MKGDRARLGGPYLRLPIPDRFVLNASKEEVSAALAAAHRDKDKLTIPYSPIVLNTGAKLVVIDTGQGEAAFERTKGAAGQFQRNLAAAGLDRSAVGRSPAQRLATVDDGAGSVGARVGDRVHRYPLLAR